MDPVRFDALTKTLSPTGTRRGLLRFAPLPLAGALALLLGREATQADGSGAISGGGNHHRNRGNTNHHHERDNGKDKCNKKCGSCERCKNGKCKAQPDGRACEGDDVCSDGTCVKGGPTHPIMCDPVLKCTSTDLGAQCCPSQNPNVQCAGGLNTGTPICQDCGRPPTAEGAFCKEPLGNHCCGGNPTCFVGIRFDNNQPGCFTDNPQGASSCQVCDATSGCPPTRVCIRNDSPLGAGCCEVLTTICATPCPAG
jgi:hypothetical protein